MTAKGGSYSFTFTHQTPDYSLNAAGSFDPITGTALDASQGLPVYLNSATPLPSAPLSERREIRALLNPVGRHPDALD